ncbi:MAG: DUF2505 domain-containing protein [Dermatophilaceae bacterium]
MKITATFDYAGTPHDVFAMLIDEEFQARKCVATGALSHSVSVRAQDDRTVIVSNRELPTDGFPDFVKSLVGATLAVTETQDWGPAGPGGARQGRLTVDIAGAPIDLAGTLSLAPAGEGSVESVEGELKARIPLIGGKIEKAAAPAIESAIRAERETGQAWLGKAT